MIIDINKLRRFVAENKTDRTLQMLTDGITTFPDLQNQVLTLTAQFADTRKKENIGLLDNREAM